MNRATVIRTTRGLADHLLATHGGAPANPVVLGFDARPDSRVFAEDTAGVLAAAGIAVRFFPEVTPTPLVAFAAKHLNAPAAVVITASHNPPADNGYKVYGANAAQIVPPVDTEIAEAIARVGPATGVPRHDGVFSATSDRVTVIPEDMVDSYRVEVDEARPNPQTSNLRIVYTPLHGVGAKVLTRMFTGAGHRGLMSVPKQVEPDGAFPTVTFPNPEEAGALDLALALAASENADLVLANDPDADRLAAALPVSDGWRMLTGNELGALLGDYVLRYWDHPETPIVVNSVVSSPMLGLIAAKRGAVHGTSLTGFKWIINAGLAMESRGDGRFAFGYEEALGYSIGRTVRDKDGISAAIVMADLAAEEAASGRSVLARLEELWDEVGLWVSAQHSIVRMGVGGLARRREPTGRRTTKRGPRDRDHRDDRLSPRGGGAPDLAGATGADRAHPGRGGTRPGEAERNRAQVEDLCGPLRIDGTRPRDSAPGADAEGDRDGSGDGGVAGGLSVSPMTGEHVAGRDRAIPTREPRHLLPAPQPRRGSRRSERPGRPQPQTRPGRRELR
jgi:phosphomannomutase